MRMASSSVALSFRGQYRVHAYAWIARSATRHARPHIQQEQASLTSQMPLFEADGIPDSLSLSCNRHIAVSSCDQLRPFKGGLTPPHVSKRCSGHAAPGKNCTYMSLITQYQSTSASRVGDRTCLDRMASNACATAALCRIKTLYGWCR